MVLRRTETRIPRKFLFNGAVALFVIGTVGLAVRHSLTTYSEPPCGERYASAMMFAWQHPSGEPLTRADLQSRLGGRDWGLDNVRFVKDQHAPAPVVIEVDVAKSAAQSAGQHANGMGFSWHPSQIRNAEAACLAYSIWLPAGFDFASGGSLPGLFGDDAPQTAASGHPVPAFASRLLWKDDGGVDMLAITADEPSGDLIPVASSWLTLDRGRWVRLEHEIVLNRPGAHDGILRVWIDGSLQAERSNLEFRGKSEHGFKGVNATVHYGRGTQPAALAGKNAAIRLTPFELRWRHAAGPTS
jgi:hypothetical protein